MIKKLIKRLRSISGESLIESMASLLIFTLASIALLSMITASARINGEARKADETHQQQMAFAEKAEKPKTGNFSVKIKVYDSRNNVLKEIPPKSVNVYQAEDGALYSYFVK